MISKFNKFQIGKYQEADFETLANVFRNVYAQTYPHFDIRFHKLERFQSILSERTLLNSKIWTAKIFGEIIGFVALEKNVIDQLYIIEKFQNSGLGGFWLDQAKTIYPDFLELYTIECNRKAIAFYKNNGFRTIKKGIAPDEKLPDVKMRWEG